MDIITCYASGPNETICLALDTAIVRWDNDDHEGPAEVLLVFEPTAHLEINLVLEDEVVIEVKELKLKNQNLIIPGFVTKLNTAIDSSGARTQLRWRPSKEPIIGLGNDSTEMETLIFHIFNFLEVIGVGRSTEQKGAASRAIEQFTLGSREWKVDLRSLFSTKDVFETLSKQGGYGITHIGRARRSENSLFSGATANEVLKDLRLFFSFAKGNWCEFLSVGFDNYETKVWESWSSPREPWRSSLSWFDPHHTDQLVRLFPGFFNRLDDENWREAIREAVYWYILSNSTHGIDAGIILSQAAIERLSFEYLVNDKRLLKKRGFKDLSASDRMRRIFSSLDIPLDIPDSLQATSQLAKDKDLKWVDAPQALTEVRNSFVHPDHKSRGKFKEATYEMWNLGLRYLELLILRLCEYEGTYSNRLEPRWVGDVENVPWI